MRTIGVRELKAHLSQVLKEVQAGESVLVTDRGRVIAELRQPESTGPARGPVERALLKMAADGHLRVGEPTPDPYPPSPLKSPAGLARQLLDAERADG
ncbi:MAG: type II toxin-antitoxin system prevent-host-death family antitoxin [Gemmatimonadales bacterium]